MAVHQHNIRVVMYSSEELLYVYMLLMNIKGFVNNLLIFFIICWFNRLFRIVYIIYTSFENIFFPSVGGLTDYYELYMYIVGRDENFTSVGKKLSQRKRFFVFMQ